MSDKYAPPEATAGDTAHMLARSALGTIPAVGNAATEFFNWLLASPLERRRVAWMHDVAEGLRALESRGIDLETLRENDAFIDIVLQACQSALRTSQQVKRQALRNAVLNAASPGAPEVAEQQIFLELVDSLTEWHLHILRLFHNPSEHVPVDAYMGGLSQIVESAFPALKGRRDFYDQIWSDLNGRGLVNTNSLHVTMTAHGMGEASDTTRGPIPRVHRVA